MMLKYSNSWKSLYTNILFFAFSSLHFNYCRLLNASNSIWPAKITFSSDAHSINVMLCTSPYSISCSSPPCWFSSFTILPSCRMDKDGNVRISWEEWRDYLLLQPHTNMKSIFQIWKHASVSGDLCISLSVNCCYIAMLTTMVCTLICALNAVSCIIPCTSYMCAAYIITLCTYAQQCYAFGSGPYVCIYNYVCV